MDHDDPSEEYKIMRSRRILSIVAVMLLLCLMLVSCETAIDKSKDYIETHKPQQSKAMVTLNMYIPSDGTISSEAVLAMQEQFNEIVEAKYNTHVIFHLVDLYTYASYLNGEIDRVVQANEKGAPTSLKPTTETNDQGVTQTVYPKEAEAQLDIFVVTGLSMLQGLVDEGFVHDITTDATSKYYRELSTDANELSISESIFWNSAIEVRVCQNDGCTTVVGEAPEYCPASVKSENALKENDPAHEVAYKEFGNTPTEKYYGIPSNSLVGQYTYQLINRELADRHDLIGYLYLEAQNNLETATSNRDKAQVAFDAVKHDSGLPNYASLKSALADATAIYEEALAISNQIKSNAIPESIVHDENKSVIQNALSKMVKVAGLTMSDVTKNVTGDYRARYSYDGYYITVIKNPVVTDSELYEGMFCISSLCANPDRAMEILVELTNNAKLHTILQYGAEGIHYTVSMDEKGNHIVSLIETPASRYAMYLKYTGNISALYACPEKGIDTEYAHYLYLQNKDATR